MNNNDMNIAIRFAVAGGQVVVKDINGITQSTTTATKSLKQLDTAGNESARGLSKAANSSKQLNTTLQENESSAVRLAGTLRSMLGVTAALYASFETFNAVKGFANVASEFDGLQQRIKTATRETRDYNQVSAEMFDISQKNGVALSASVDLFQRMATSRKDLKATNAEMLGLTDAVQMLGVIGGSSMQAMDNGLMQLSQGLSGGILRAEEWNSILENIPELASRIGRGMDDIGKSTKELGFGEMRALVLEGKLLSEDVLKSILVQLPEIRAQFGELPVNMARANVMVENSFAATVAHLDKTVELSNAWAQSLVGVAQIIDSVRTGNIEALSPALQASIKTAELLAYAIGVVGVAAFAGFAKKQAAVLMEMLLVNTAAVTQVSALGLVTTTAGTATVASNALAIAQRALLGPIGLVIGVAGVLTGAWFAYEHAAEQAKQKNEELANSFARMSNQRKASVYQDSIAELQQVAARIVEIDKQLEEARKKSKPSNGFGVGDVNASADIARLAPELGELKKRREELNAVIEQLNKNFDAGLPALDQYSSKLEDSSDKSSVLNDELLKLYNTQMLSAQAIDAQGRALTGVDLELFKAQFIDATTLPANAAAAIKKFAEEAKTATANLNADTYLQQLREELKLLDLRLRKGQQSADMQKKLQQFTGANPAALEALQRELQLIEKKQALVTDKETLDSLKKETELLQIRLAKGEKEYEVQKALYQLKGGDPAVIAEIENQIRVQQKLKDQIELTEQISSGAFDKMLDDMTAMNGIATNIGDVLVQAFGSVAQQLDAMTESQLQYNEKVKELAGEKAKLNILDKNSAVYAKGKAAVDEKEAKLKNDYYQSQMGHFASLTGAASKMFSEQSKGRQVLHKLEVTFAAIETALALKKAAANALTAITNQGGGDPYSAFARIAAMAALMAGLGVFSGSAGGGGVSAEDRQKSQGTGTVLGDDSAKSESIANALGRIEDLELDQYAELRSINGSIRELSAGIKNLAVNLVASYGKFNESSYPGELGKEYNLQLGSGLASVVGGGVIGLVADKLLGGLVGGLTNKLLGGLFGSKKTELVDSGLSFAAQELGDIISSGLMNATVYDVIKTTKKKLFGLSKSTSESTEYRAIDNALRAEFSRIFSHMGKSVTEAVNLLGLETNKTLESFVINLPALSFKDLKGDEIEKELQAMFSQQGDLMVQYLVPGIAEFQQIGEGLYDTLIRVAQEQAVFNSALDNLGLQLSRFAGVTKAIELEVAQSIIELMGGIEQFQSATADYFAEFYSEQEQLAAITKSATAQFASLGVAMPQSRDGFKALVDSLDLTTDAGQRMFAALMALVPAMDQYYDQQERKARELASFNKSIGDELAKLDMTDLQKSLFDLKAWYDAQIKEAAELGADTSLLEKLYDRKRAALIAAELEKATTEINNTFKQLVDSIQSASAGIGNSILDIRRQMTGWDESAYQAGQVKQLRGQLGTGDITAQIKAIQSLQGAIVSRYQADISANNLLMQQAQAALDSLNASWGELTSSLASVRSSISAAILDIRRQGSGWNEVGYQKGNITGLRSKLGAGSVLDQINTVSALQQAIVDRYNAELAANAQLATAAQARYEADVAAHNALRDAAKQLLAAADSLLLSDLNPALMGDQFTEAQKQFNQLLNKARSGDADAMQQLSGVGNSYLELARDYYASGSSEYAAIFNQVQQAYRSFGGLANSAEATVPRAVLEYQQADSLLQQQSIKELEELQLLLDDLEKKAAEEKAAAEALAKAELAAYQARQLELQEGAIAELTELQTMLDQLEAQAAAQRDAQLAIAQQQLDAATSLRAGMSEIAVAIGNMPPPVVNVTVNVAAPAAASAAATAAAESVVSDLLQQQLAEQRHTSELQARQMSALQDDMQRTQAMMFESRRQA